jgi:hypothetical protein
VIGWLRHFLHIAEPPEVQPRPKRNGPNQDRLKAKLRSDGAEFQERVRTLELQAQARERK